jgi:hypothetical protein
VLLGEPGAGKTALLAAATQQARSAGVLVLPANGVEFEADIPSAGLGQVALPLVEGSNGLSPGHQQVLRTALGLGEGPFPAMGAVANAALALLTQASRSQPLLVTVDDLQWVDRLSAAALSFVAARQQPADRSARNLAQRHVHVPRSHRPDRDRTRPLQ